jgi:hypothetical protein
MDKFRKGLAVIQEEKCEMKFYSFYFLATFEETAAEGSYRQFELV